MKRVVVLSLAVHVALFAWLARTRPVITAPAPVAAELELELDVDDNVPAMPSAAEAPAVAIAVVRTSAPTPTEAPASAKSTTTDDAMPADAAPYASNGTLIVMAPSIGIGGPNPFLRFGPGPEQHIYPNGVSGAPGAASADPMYADPMYVPLEKRAEQSVKDALRARDQKVGLGLEGPVVRALEDATHAGFAPDRGNATFLAVIDERGLVIDLKILSSNATAAAGARGWEEVRQRAVRSLATAKIDMRGVKRAELKIAVESEVLLPSGNKPEAPIKPSGKPTQTRIVTEAPASPSGADVVASVEVTTFDVTDIGAKAQRVVHAKLVLMTTR